MKISSTFCVLFFLMALLIFSKSTVALAQQNPIDAEAEVEAEARAQAIADAENDAHKTTWFMAGCFLNVIGVVIANTGKVPVPAGRLVGKSPAYVAAYTSSYQARLTQIQSQSAGWGCALGTLGCLVAYTVSGYIAGALLIFQLW